LADIATNPYDLIDNAKAVASFSMGSTTFEALARGKPVVLGGKAWYRDAPGIIAVDSVDDVKRALDLVSKGAHVDRQETREYLIKVMMHKTYPVLPPDKYGDPLFTRRAVDDLSRSIAHRVTSLFN
jgi:hypothetical protein